MSNATSSSVPKKRFSAFNRSTPAARTAADIITPSTTSQPEPQLPSVLPSAPASQSQAIAQPVTQQIYSVLPALPPSASPSAPPTRAAPAPPPHSTGVRYPSSSSSSSSRPEWSDSTDGIVQGDRVTNYTSYDAIATSTPSYSTSVLPPAPVGTKVTSSLPRKNSSPKRRKERNPSPDSSSLTASAGLTSQPQVYYESVPQTTSVSLSAVPVQVAVDDGVPSLTQGPLREKVSLRKQRVPGKDIDPAKMHEDEHLRIALMQKRHNADLSMAKLTQRVGDNPSKYDLVAEAITNKNYEALLTTAADVTKDKDFRALCAAGAAYYLVHGSDKDTFRTVATMTFFR